MYKSSWECRTIYLPDVMLNVDILALVPGLALQGKILLRRVHLYHIQKCDSCLQGSSPCLGFPASRLDSISPLGDPASVLAQAFAAGLPEGRPLPRGRAPYVSAPGYRFPWVERLLHLLVRERYLQPRVRG